MSVTEIALPEVKKLAARVDAALASKEGVSGHDLAILRDALDTWWLIADELQDGDMSLRRLREIFGVAPKASPPPPPPTDSDGETDGNGRSKTPQEGGRNANHPGRRSAQDVPVASTHIHTDPYRHAGSPCEGEGCKGRLYHFKRDGKFRTLLRIVGGAPLQAERHIFQDLRCNLCGTIYPAPAPVALTNDGPLDQMYGYSAMATVALYKYMGGTPWYRQAKLQDNLGLDVSPSTQWDLCEALANAAKPVYTQLLAEAANYSLFFADDASFKILSEKDGEVKIRRSSGKEVQRDGCHTSCIIAQEDGGRRAALFKTGIVHAGEWMDELLRRRHSGLSPPMHMADRSTSNSVTVCSVHELACNAHLRNRFDELKTSFRMACGKMLDLYKKIYKVDAATKDMDPTARLGYLREHAAPMMDQIFRTARSELENCYTEPNSRLGKVYQYALNHEPELRGFLKYPGAPLDNNCCEAMLARVVILRNNVWFYKNMVGAWVSDVIMTLGQSAVLAGANPYDYYAEILRHQTEARTRPADFMPWNYRATVDRLCQRTAAAS